MRGKGEGKRRGKKRERVGKGGKVRDGKGKEGKGGKRGEWAGACTHWDFRKSAPMYNFNFVFHQNESA